jgi:hypothetical protein
MNELRFQELIDVVSGAESQYHKLVILAGRSGAGKTRLLRGISATLNIPLVNLNLQVSKQLLSLTIRQRTLKAEETALGVVDTESSTRLCLDNTEMLFESSLHLNPLLFLQSISRNRVVVASWNGEFGNGVLTFGYPGHPDFFTEPVCGFSVVSIFEDKLQLHFAS